MNGYSEAKVLPQHACISIESCHCSTCSNPPFDGLNIQSVQPGKGMSKKLYLILHASVLLKHPLSVRIKRMLYKMQVQDLGNCLHETCRWQLAIFPPATTCTTLTSDSRLHWLETDEMDFSEPEHRRCHNKHHKIIKLLWSTTKS